VGWRRRRRQLLVGGAPTSNSARCGAGASGRLQSCTRQCELDARQGGFAAECAREFHAGAVPHAGATDLFFAVCQPPEAHCSLGLWRGGCGVDTTFKLSAATRVTVLQCVTASIVSSSPAAIICWATRGEAREVA
jgi:hypothetical protein